MANGNIDPITMMGSQEKLSSVNENLSAIRTVIETAVNEAKSTGSGMLAGLGQLRQDVGSSLQGLSDIGKSIQPMTHTDTATAFRPHHGMFLHQQGLMTSVAASVGLRSLAPTPEGIDPHSYKIMSQQSLGRKMSGIAIGAGGGALEAAGSIGGWTAGAAAGTAIAKGAAMGAFGAAALPIAVGAAAGLAVDHVLEKVGPVARAREKRELEDVMKQSSWRMSGTQWGKGELGGMSEGQLSTAATGIRGLSKTTNFDFGEVKTVLGHGMARGLYDNVTSETGMVSRTRELLQDVKAVSNRAHVPMESAIGVMADLKEMGFDKNPAAAMMKFDTMGMASGRTATEMMSFGKQGAEMVRGTGISMDTGALGAAGMLQQVRGLQMAGVYSPETVRQMGGAETMAMTQMHRSQQFIQTNPMFRGMAMSMIGTGSAANLDPSQVAGAMGASPMQMIQKAYSSGEGGFTGFANKALEFQKNQGEFIDQIGVKGVQKMEDVSIMKKVQMATQILPSGMTDTAEKRESIMFDIATRSGMSHPEAKAFISRMGNLDAEATGHGKAMAIQGRKSAAEEEEANTRWKRTKRAVGRKVENAYNFVGGISGPDFKVGRMLSAVGRGIDNMFSLEEDERVRVEFDEEDKEARNMETRASLLGKNERAAAHAPLDAAIKRSADREKEGKFLQSDVDAFAKDDRKMRMVRGKKTEDDVASAVMIASTGKGGFNTEAFISEMGWKGEDKKPIDPKNLSPKQKKFMAASMDKHINKEEDPKGYQMAQDAKKKLGLVKSGVEDIVKQESELADTLKGNEWNPLSKGSEGDLKDMAEDLLPGVIDTKLEDVIESDDESAELTLQLASYLEAPQDAKGRAATALRKTMEDKGMTSKEIRESMEAVSGITQEESKDFISKAEEVAGQKEKRLALRITRDVESGAISQKEAVSIRGALEKKEFTEVEKKLGLITGEEDVSQREVTKTAEVSQDSQNKFNGVMLHALQMIVEKLEGK